MRLCTLLYPQITADIAEAYPSGGDIWVVQREDDPASAMLNSSMLSEKYGGASRR